ncbi:MAG: fluoride efflux transporter CrcB [Micrococcales bacterium]|nr:fluoride efflux transporter CrcB [Micrococcales bacterium]
MSLLLISLAGGLGAVARFVVDALVNRRLRPGALPLGTLTVNITGSFVLGLVTGIALGHSGFPAGTQAVIGTGFCGGFTTFSTASLEVVRLWDTDGGARAAAYLVSMVIGSVLAALLGLWAATLV